MSSRKEWRAWRSWELKRVKHRSRIRKKQVQGGMGRAGRVAPRTCSTLELRTHLSSSSSSMLLTLPTSTMKPSSSPPSPSTPVQAAPASTTPPLQQEWPQDALQVVQLQLESLRSHASFANEPVTRKRGFEASSAVIGKVDQQGDVSAGFEVELHAQPALPEDWEQFLDLKVRKTRQSIVLHFSKILLSLAPGGSSLTRCSLPLNDFSVNVALSIHFLHATYDCWPW